MKKYISILAVLALCSCAKEFTGGEERQLRTESLTARIASTKVAISDEGKFSWTAGDQIAVHRSVSGYETAALTVDGAFNIHLSDGEVRDGYAVYPAAIATDDASLSVCLPAAYAIPKTGMADYSPVPMVAVNDPFDEDIYFHHLGGLIRLVLESVPYETQEIHINLGKKVTGTFAVAEPDSASPYISVSDEAPEDIVYTLASPVTASDQSFVINVPVPVGTYESVSMKIYDRYGNLAMEDTKEIYVQVERADGYTLDEDLRLDVSVIPLCFKMARNGNLRVTNPKSLTMEYSYDNQSWTSFSSELSLALSKGDQVFFRGNNAAYGADSRSNSVRFICDSKCYFYGNVMSLITPDPADFSTLKVLTEPYTFANMFNDEDGNPINPRMGSHPTYDLLLPATTLADYCYCDMFDLVGIDRIELPATNLAIGCYSNMFEYARFTKAPQLPATTLYKGCYRGMFRYCGALKEAPELPATTLENECYASMFENCTSLVSAPELPATVMARECYYEMFEGCENLRVAPELPATTLAIDCYRYMFNRCINLETAPQLPAVTLASGCYYGMFEWCENLRVAPELPATTMDTYCYENMFEHCTGLVAAPQLPATTLADACYRQMFEGCTSLVEAPVLPATTLAMSCYQEMFMDCSSLGYVKAMFTEISGSSNLTNWLSGVPETGEFVMNEAATYDPVTDAGVPSGWTITKVTE